MHWINSALLHRNPSLYNFQIAYVHIIFHYDQSSHILYMTWKIRNMYATYVILFHNRKLRFWLHSVWRPSLKLEFRQYYLIIRTGTLPGNATGFCVCLVKCRPHWKMFQTFMCINEKYFIFCTNYGYSNLFYIQIPDVIKWLPWPLLLILMAYIAVLQIWWEDDQILNHV